MPFTVSNVQIPLGLVILLEMLMIHFMDVQHRLTGAQRFMLVHGDQLLSPSQCASKDDLHRRNGDLIETRGGRRPPAIAMLGPLFIGGARCVRCTTSVSV